MHRLGTLLIAGALSCSAPVSLSAQETQPDAGQGVVAPTLPGLATPPSGGISPLPYRILDQDRFLRGSQLGQQILARVRAAEARLQADNQTLFDQLAAEERALTEARATLSAEEFRAQADAFDARVETIRMQRAQISQQLSQWSEGEAQRFYDAALPVLVQLMNDEGILALFRPETVILGSDILDMTDAAIARLDASGIDETDPVPAPDTSPEAVPSPSPSP